MGMGDRIGEKKKKKKKKRRRDARKERRSIERLKSRESPEALFLLSHIQNLNLGLKKKIISNQQNVSAFPARGGANGSIRYTNEAAHGANKGLNFALDLLAPVAAKHADVSFADLFQLAWATAVEVAGGPEIPMRYGRKDAPGPESETPEGNLPAGGAPWPKGAAGPAEHLREVFYRMGLDDKEIVALSGAHTLGRAKPSRSGFGKEITKYTAKGPGTPGGSSWSGSGCNGTTSTSQTWSPRRKTRSCSCSTLTQCSSPTPASSPLRKSTPRTPRPSTRTTRLHT